MNQNKISRIVLLSLFVTFCLLVGSFNLVVAIDIQSDNPNAQTYILSNTNVTTSTYNNTYLNFSATDDELNMTFRLDYNLTSNFSQFAFINKEKTPLAVRSISDKDSAYKVYVQANDRLGCNFYGLDDTFIGGSKIVPNNTWTFLGCSYNSSYMNTYFNGILSVQDTGVGSVTTNIKEIFIGITEAGNTAFNGSIDDYYLFNDTLSPGNIARIYNSSELGSGLGRSVPVLSYHQVENPADEQTEVNSTEFNRTLTWLYNNDYTTVTYDEFFSQSYDLSKHPVILSFDDARKSVYTNATPLLNQYKFKGVVNVITNRPTVDTVNHMTWGEIGNLLDLGWQVASHSQTHCRFISECNSTDNWTSELSGSKQDIIGNLSVTPSMYVYAYNSGNSTTDDLCDDYYSLCSRTTNSVDDYQIFTFEKSNKTHSAGSPIGLRRLEVDNETTLEEIAHQVDYYSKMMIHLNLNENTGTVAYDSSGRSNNGTISGATWNNDGITITNTINPVLTVLGTLLTSPAELIYSQLVSKSKPTVTYTFLNNTDTQAYNLTVYNITNAFIYFSNGTVLCTNLSTCDTVKNLTLNEGNYTYIYDNYVLTEGTTLTGEPLAFSSSSSTKKKITNSLDTTISGFNISVNTGDHDCSTINKITYTTDSGTVTTWTDGSARDLCSSRVITFSSLNIEPATSSNTIDIEYGTSSLQTIILKLVVGFVALLVVVISATGVYMYFNEGEIVSLSLGQFIKLVVSIFLVTIMAGILINIIYGST